MAERYDFHDVGRLPVPGDNVAIATRRLEGGTTIRHDSGEFALSHTVLEGHRFVLRPIAAEQPLLSWGLPFGFALRDIAQGEYMCNARILWALRRRNLDFPLPEKENFRDHLVPYELDAAAFRAGRQVPLDPSPGTFSGFDRGPARGVGTRNHVVVLATSSRTAGYARLLAERLKDATEAFPNVDRVVAVAHTEGGGAGTPNNMDFILRTLGGFMVHPNVGAVLAVDYGGEAVCNRVLRDFMIERGYALDEVTHEFLTLEGNFGEALQRGEALVKEWLPKLDGVARGEAPLANLKLALQCGGSDAFSGVSGNPLAGWVAKETIRHGGSANLAETDELIGAESYVLENIRDLATARRFLEKIEVFRERASWHGQSLEGNPSAGNNFRGLYNIALKSIGAARKRDPEVRLDYVIDYAEPMSKPGYYFMDSPGNDLESIAGQVASGANMILFITGNGSITNFPFVPTIKIMTTSSRFELLSHDMDVNAGRYQDGTPMEELGREAFQYTREVASGKRSVGEKAGHSQVSIWRDWQQQDGTRLERIRAAAAPAGEPLPVRTADAAPFTFSAIESEDTYTTDQVGLILPASLCSGQIAKIIAEKLNAQGVRPGVSRFVALVHTEGCGSAGGDSEQIFLRTLLGHLRHPVVRKGLLLEHGCEKTVNDYIRGYMEKEGMAPEDYGWASVQLDGGIDAVVEKVADWFAANLDGDSTPSLREVGAEYLRVGLTAMGEVSDPVARACARVAASLLAGGGTVVVPENAALWGCEAFRAELLAGTEAYPTLAYGQFAEKPGLHVMATPTDHPVETLSGLGATGVEIMLAHVAGPPLQAHPMIPLIQVSGDEPTRNRWGADLEELPEAAPGAEAALAAAMLELLRRVASREYTPKLYGQGNTDFQVTRGLLGISM